AATAQGEHHRAVGAVLPLLSEDELNEPLARTLMRALAADGRHPEALAVFERLRDGIEREYGGVPDPRTRRLYRDLLAGSTLDLGPVPEPPASADGPDNLPVAVTELIGREEELEELGTVLGRTRLLTLTGPGGVGKTRLATELARRRRGAHPDGVWLVELAALSRPELLAQHVAAELGLTLPERGDPSPALVRQLGGRRLLLLLDNCEHLIDPCARLVDDVLHRCPGVVLVTTSREPLRTEGEVARRVSPLAVPRPGATARELGRVAAARLFVQRARAVVPHFALTDANAPAIGRVCVELDGMPLALELAAARLSTLDPAQLATRLDDALGVLGTGHRTAPARQRTLRATVEWSYRLLDEVERAVFRHTGVFSGGFTLGALEAVCGRDVDRAARASVLQALVGLVDKSLVVTEHAGGSTRYRVLATIRQYAGEALVGAGEAGPARRRHLAWFRTFAAGRDMTTGVDDRAAELDAEHDDLRSALEFALREDPEAALDLAVALWPYWLARGRFREGTRWLEDALAAAPAAAPAEGRALFALAVLDVRCGRGERLAELGARHVAVQRGLPGSEPAQALQLGGILAFMAGDWAAACGRAEECLAVAGAGDGPAAAAVHLLGLVALSRGRLDAAHELLVRTLDMLQAVTGRVRPFFSPVMLGVAVERAADGPRTMFEETMLQARLVDAERASAYVRCNLAFLARLRGDLDEAAAQLEAALGTTSAQDDPVGRGVVLNHLGCLLRVRGEFGAGRRALREALRIREGLGDRRAAGLTTVNLGLLAAASGDVAHGRDLVRLAATGFRETRDDPGTIGTVAALADVALDTGDAAGACRLLEHAVARSRGSPGDHRWSGWMAIMLARARRSAGRTAAAEESRRAAEEVFTRLGAVDGLVVCAGEPSVVRGPGPHPLGPPG
ncbi:ATP-binding protein, partial [Pseudonocardia sp. RS010]|uniref:ATP-binding protein n=1 Tax=Pseudonocardia sp. RS010 TaxID=3385979 RepID=UPI0039A1CBF1